VPEAFERRALQACIVLGGLVPVTAGLYGALSGDTLLGAALPAAGDSHVRYLSGLLLAIGLGFWSLVPRVEQHIGRARLLTALVVTGGLFRIAGFMSGSTPSPGMIAAAVMEVVVTPGLCLWQARVASRHRGKKGAE
jgi:Domain of unknown function (DUF4345)